VLTWRIPNRNVCLVSLRRYLLTSKWHTRFQLGAQRIPSTACNHRPGLHAPCLKPLGANRELFPFCAAIEHSNRRLIREPLLSSADADDPCWNSKSPGWSLRRQIDRSVSSRKDFCQVDVSQHSSNSKPWPPAGARNLQCLSHIFRCRHPTAPSRSITPVLSEDMLELGMATAVALDDRALCWGHLLRIATTVCACSATRRTGTPRRMLARNFGRPHRRYRKPCV